MTAVEVLKEAIREAIDTLEDQDCTFWACDGPDAPPVSMKTCGKCWTIINLRASLEATR